MKKTNLVVRIIGLIGIAVGFFQLFNGETFQELYFLFFISITLIGSTFFDYQVSKKESCHPKTNE